MYEASFWIALAQITGINILLSGDNAVVIALACRGLSPRNRRWGIVLGSAAAILMRLLFSLFVAALFHAPYVRLVAGVLLLWIAAKLIADDHSNPDRIRSSANLWGAVMTIAIADAVMSLDNVIAISAVAQGNVLLLGLGLVLSVPLIVCGSSLLIGLFKRVPSLLYVGAALLGYVAGQVALDDPAFDRWPSLPDFTEWLVPVICGALALGLGWLLGRVNRQSAPA